AVAPDPEKPSPESLRKFLKEETQALVFWTYMKRMYNHELFSFWFAIDEYRDLPEDNLQLAANWIFEKYFRQGSEFELSIAADFRKAIEQEMTSGPTVCINFPTCSFSAETHIRCRTRCCMEFDGL